MKVFHGTKVDFDGPLEPRFIAGSNGSHDGIGINATDHLNIAINYAGEEGCVHVVDLNTDGFIKISDKQKLTEEQANRLGEFLGQFDNAVKTRISTDLVGKKPYTFKDKEEAKDFLKSKRKELTDMSLYLDRMKPEVEEYEEGNYVIIAAHRDMDLSSVSTEHIHYILNLLDNYLATNALKSISDGLILEKDGFNNYLSFRRCEEVIKKYPAKEIERMLDVEIEGVSFEQ